MIGLYTVIVLILLYVLFSAVQHEVNLLSTTVNPYEKRSKTRKWRMAPNAEVMDKRNETTRVICLIVIETVRNEETETGKSGTKAPP